jgi:hypothetical protein
MVTDTINDHYVGALAIFALRWGFICKPKAIAMSSLICYWEAMRKGFKNGRFLEQV